jgi:hypothetical protein
MIKKVMLFLSFIITVSGYSQEFMSYKGSKAYPATNSWDFICENYALTGSAKVQIAKTDKGGTLKIAVETTDSSFVISGMVYVYLTDNTVITCSDKGVRENVGKDIVAYYTFSQVEMNKLKMTEIQSIHFNIKGNQNKFSSQTGNFTAVNKVNYFATAYDRTKKSYNTAAEIKALNTVL